jgi:hypothetical protein
MRRGAKVIGFRSFDLKSHWCVPLHQIDSYLDLTKDWELRPQQSPSWEGLYKLIRVVLCNSYILEALQGDCQQQHLMADN